MKRDGMWLALMALAYLFVVLGTVFTLSPEFLEHSPIGFEKRGAVHHVWHYMILIGGLTLLFGLLTEDRVLEALGLVGCGAPVLLNLVASLTAEDESLSGPLSAASGIDIVVRLAVLGLIAARLAEMRWEDR